MKQNIFLNFSGELNDTVLVHCLFSHQNTLVNSECVTFVQVSIERFRTTLCPFPAYQSPSTQT